MSLQQVSLDPFLLAQLYKTAIIPSEKTADTNNAATGALPSITINFFGNNTRRITLLIYNKEQTWLPEELFTFLTKILQACGLSMDDVALVNIAYLPEVQLSEITNQLNAEKLIMLGSWFKDWSGKILEKNKIQVLEGLPCLYSDSLGEMQANASYKKAFWNALQDFFGLKK